MFKYKLIALGVDVRLHGHDGREGVDILNDNAANIR